MFPFYHALFVVTTRLRLQGYSRSTLYSWSLCAFGDVFGGIRTQCLNPSFGMSIGRATARSRSDSLTISLVLTVPRGHARGKVQGVETSIPWGAPGTRPIQRRVGQEMVPCQPRCIELRHGRDWLHPRPWASRVSLSSLATQPVSSQAFFSAASASARKMLWMTLSANSSGNVQARAPPLLVARAKATLWALSLMEICCESLDLF